MSVAYVAPKENFVSWISISHSILCTFSQPNDDDDGDGGGDDANDNAIAESDYDCDYKICQL